MGWGWVGLFAHQIVAPMATTSQKESASQMCSKGNYFPAAGGTRTRARRGLISFCLEQTQQHLPLSRLQTWVMQVAQESPFQSYCVERDAKSKRCMDKTQEPLLFLRKEQNSSSWGLAISDGWCFLDP